MTLIISLQPKPLKTEVVLLTSSLSCQMHTIKDLFMSAIAQIETT